MRVIARITNPGRIYSSIKGTEKLFSKSVFEGPTRRLVRSIKIPTAIFADNNFTNAANVLVPVYTAEDIFLFTEAGRLALNNGSHIIVLDFYSQIAYNDEMNRELNELSTANPGKVEVILPEMINMSLSDEYDLLLVSQEGWHKFVHDKRVNRMPSALIFKSRQN